MEIKKTMPRSEDYSRRAPAAKTFELIPSTDFILAVEEFCRDYLVGVAEFHSDEYPNGYVTLCAERTAFLLKLIVDATPRGSMLIFTVDSDKYNLIIKAELDTDECDGECFSRAAALAGRIGFSATLIPDGIILKTKLTRSNVYRVYAGGTKRFYLTLKKFLSEFFVNKD